jgi:glycosyltransferase involved in cell wall biosynthesis
VPVAKNAICLITQSVYDIDPRVKRKAEALVAAGYSVDVLALRSRNGKAIYFADGVKIRTLSLGKQRGSILRYTIEYAVFFLWAFLRVTIQERRKHYSVIDINTLPDFLIFAALPGRWMGAKLVLDMHEITPEFFISKYKVKETSWKVRFLKYLEKHSFDFADHVITISDPVQNLLSQRSLPGPKTTVITNSADDAKFTSPEMPLPRGVLENQGKFVMIYHGTLTKIYGLDIAIEAFARVHGDMPNAQLWILGDGPEVSALRDLIRDYDLSTKVHLVGRVPLAEIPSWLGQSNVGILPIRRDIFLDFAFPNKLPEYILAGKAVIVSRLKTIRYYFSEDSLAYFEPNDAADLAQQMLRMYGNPELCVRLANRAREEYKPIRWDVMKERYVELMDHLSGRVGVKKDGANGGAEEATCNQSIGSH